MTTEAKETALDKDRVPQQPESEGDMEDDEENEEEEKEVIFRSLSRRTPSTVAMVSHSLYNSASEDQILPPLVTGTSDFWRHIFEVPFRAVLERDAENHIPMPILFSLIQVQGVGSTLVESKKFFVLNLAYGGGFTWRVHRRMRDFVKLHSLLTFRHMKGALPKLPNFPKQTLKLRSEENSRLLSTYLKELLRAFGSLTCTELCEFLEISSLGLKTVGSLNEKGKEGYLKLKIYEVKSRWRALLCACLPDPSHYSTKWVIFTQSGLVLLDRIGLEAPSDIFLFDASLTYSLHQNDLAWKKPTILLANGNRRMELKPANRFQAHLWMQELGKARASFPMPHRFGSFASVRLNCDVEYFVDAREYYDRLVTEIEKAEKEVFIQGWWVSPKLYLRRPAAENEESRLDRLLQRKAAEGVVFYILVFKEITISLPLNSAHTKVSLQKLHPNIRVQRHPDHSVGVLYWAHHEKIVVVDRKVAFCGGIDLCYGRFDDSRHVLNDWYPADDQKKTTWTGLDYSNPRVKEFRNVVQCEESMVDRRTVPRMPWHDVHFMMRGGAVQDVSRHFIERWNFVKSSKSMHREALIPFLIPHNSTTVETVNGSSTVQVLRHASEWSHGLRNTERSIYTTMIDLVEQSRKYVYVENQFFISQTGDSPDSIVRNSFARALVKRILRAHEEGTKFKVIMTLPLIPAFEAASSEPATVRLIMQAQYSSLCRGKLSIFGILQEYGIDPEEYILLLALRSRDVLAGKHVTEQIYVHSKVLIADDHRAVVGSANINDRSLLGYRDSEVACMIEGPSVKDLRTRLFAEHLGTMEGIDDVLSCYDQIKEVSARNTQIYRELFKCIPDDAVANWEEYRERYAKLSTDRWDSGERMRNLAMVQGNWVRFSTGFLREEDLLTTPLSAEALLPIQVFI